ncbi:hypothetical protein CCH79_00018446, partial [Gambusia affinis]
MLQPAEEQLGVQDGSFLQARCDKVLVTNDWCLPLVLALLLLLLVYAFLYLPSLAHHNTTLNDLVEPLEGRNEDNKEPLGMWPLMPEVDFFGRAVGPRPQRPLLSSDSGTVCVKSYHHDFTQTTADKPQWALSWISTNSSPGVTNTVPRVPARLGGQSVAREAKLRRRLQDFIGGQLRLQLCGWTHSGEKCAVVAMGTAVGNSDVWFRFNEGMSNAVRRNGLARISSGFRNGSSQTQPSIHFTSLRKQTIITMSEFIPEWQRASNSGVPKMAGILVV